MVVCSMRRTNMHEREGTLTSNVHERLNALSSTAGDRPGCSIPPVRSQYALSSSSASSTASLPKVVGNTLWRPALSCAVVSARAAPRMVCKSSSRNALIESRASAESFVGRTSERITSAEREEM